MWYTGEDQSIKLWDIGSSRLIKTMRGHQSSIYSLCFSAESSILASGGADESVRIWDVHSVPEPCKPIKMVNGGGGGAGEAVVMKGDPYATIKLLRKGLFGLHEYPAR